MPHVLHLGSLKHSFSEIISEYEVNRRSSNELLRSIEIAKNIIFICSSKSVAAKQLVHACSMALGLHRIIIPISRSSCELSTFRNCDNFLSFSN